MKKKILLLHNILWSRYKAIVFSEFNRLMEDSIFELYVIQFAMTEMQRKGLGTIDLTDHRYPYKMIFSSSLDEVPWYRKLSKIFVELKTHSFDIIIIPGYAYIMCWCALLYSMMTNKIIVVSFDSTELDNPKYWWKESLKKWFISKCSAAMCYGTNSRLYLLKLGMPDATIFTRCQATDNQTIDEIHGEVHLNRESNQLEAKVCPHNFIYVGRLSKEKNIEILLSAYSKVKLGNEQAADWGLIIVGDGPEKEHLQQMVDKLGVRDVCFTGGRKWSEIPRYYALSDVFVLPSLSEPWGLVVNEAMVCGLPVLVSSCCGSAPDLVSERINGFTFEPKDEQDLQKKLAFFVDHPQEVKQMGERSREIIANFSPQKAAQQMMKCVVTVVEENLSA